MKPKLAFVDHSFHAKTRSGDFLRELFSAHYEIIDFWDESWNGGPAVTAEAVNASGAEVVYFFQSLMPFPELRRLHGRIIWAPMYDSVPLRNRAFWLELGTLPIKLMTFSLTLHKLLLNYNLDSIYAQYWFDPATLPQVTDYSNVRVFFWQRTDITFAQVKVLFEDAAIARCVVKLNPDPRYTATRPTAEDIARYHIELIETGFTTKEQYLELLKSCNVFICPRRYEGIGMSFLEAMAMGLVPIAVDHPTMNEYIRSGYNGWLTSEEFTPFDLSNLSTLGRNVHTSSQQGYVRWQAHAPAILDFLRSPATPRRRTVALRAQILWHNSWYYGWLVLERIGL